MPNRSKPADLKTVKLAMKVIAKRPRRAGRNSLTEIEAKQVFAAYGLPVTATELANIRR